MMTNELLREADQRMTRPESAYTAPAVGAGVRFLSAGHSPTTHLRSRADLVYEQPIG